MGWGIVLGICCGVVVFGAWCFVRFVCLFVTVWGFDFGVVLWVGCLFCALVYWSLVL